MNKPLAIVTGGAGFIGSHTVDRMVADGYSVAVVDNFSTGKRENLATWATDNRVTIIEADLTDGLFAPLAAVVPGSGQVSCIVHLAAQTSVTRSLRNPLQDARNNYLATIHVMEYARCQGIRNIVYASSSAVYSAKARIPVTEDAELFPISPYAVDKLASEYWVRSYCQLYGMSATVLRFFNVYGPRQDPSSPYSGVVSVFLHNAFAGLPLTIFGDGLQTRDFVYVGDVAAAVSAACTATHNYPALNIGTGVETNIIDLAQTIIDLAGSTSATRHGPPRPGELPRSAATIDRARAALAFTPCVDLRTGLHNLISHLRNGRPGSSTADPRSDFD